METIIINVLLSLIIIIVLSIICHFVKFKSTIKLIINDDTF